MTKEQLKNIVAEKVEAAVKATEHPKKFFVTENGRGVVDGGDLYNAVFKDVLNVVQIALVDIIDEALNSSVKVQAPQAESKVSESKVSVSKNPPTQRDRRR